MIATRNDPAVLLRVPKEVLKRLDSEAKRAGRSRNSEILARLMGSLGVPSGKPEAGGKSSGALLSTAEG